MREITLLDGGLGQEIYRRSGKPAHPLWSVMVMKEQPEVVAEVHRDFIEAGARVITTNNYASTPSRLQRDGKLEWFEPLQRQATEAALKAREESGKKGIQIACCLPPLIGSYSLDPRTPSEIKKEYKEIVDIQASEVDFFIIETISNIKEAKAACEVAQESGKPYALSLTLADDSPIRLRSGESVEETKEALSAYDLSALMFNCSFPEIIGEGLKILKGMKIPFGAYANGFTTVDPLKPGGTVDSLSVRKDLDEEAYSRQVLSWVEGGASIVGGCCEVGPSYIAHLHKQLEAEGYLLKGL